MKVKTAFLFFVCVLFTTFCSAQQDKIDSLKKVVATAPEDSNKVNSLIKLSDKYRLVSADSALTYANEAKALGEKINYRKGTGYALKAIGMVYNLREDYVNALQVWKEALKIFEEDSFKVGAANMLNNIGVMLGILPHSVPWLAQSSTAMAGVILAVVWQGFPFFAPLFVAGNEWDVYGPRQVGRQIEEVLAGQMHYPYFPVPLETLAATIRYHELAEETLDLAGVRVTTRYLNHPAPAIGYRLQAGGVTVVYATDHEPHSPHHPEAAGEPERVHREDERHIEFLAGADLVIHDAQYTLEEYPARLTWGHTPAELAVDFAGAARATRLALFHHDPSRTDDALDALLARCRARPSGLSASTADNRDGSTGGCRTHARHTRHWRDSRGYHQARWRLANHGNRVCAGQRRAGV